MRKHFAWLAAAALARVRAPADAVHGTHLGEVFIIKTFGVTQPRGAALDA
jgi:hypothetical protein